MKKLLYILVILLLLIPIASAQEQYGYIVELKEDPAIKNADSNYDMGSASVADQTQDILKEQASFKNRLSSLLGTSGMSGGSVGATSTGGSLPIIAEYTTVFNGMALDIDESIANKIKSFPEVKGVYPNLEVNVSLSDSVPLLDADDVWQLDADGTNCAQSGKPCLTGQGVKIGVLDTGVDPSHESLGSSEYKIPSVEYNLMGEDVKSSFDAKSGYSISADDGFVYYVSKTEAELLYRKNILTNESELVKTYAGEILFMDINYPYALVSNYIYDSEGEKNVVVTLTNLETGYVVDIVDTYGFEGISFDGFQSNDQISVVAYAKTKINESGGYESSPYEVLLVHNANGTIEDISDILVETIESSYRDFEIVSPYKLYGNTIVKSSSADYCFGDFLVYDAETKESVTYSPELTGRVNDFDGDRILYSVCDPDNYDSSWSTQGIYSISEDSLEVIGSGSTGSSSAPRNNLDWVGWGYSTTQSFFGDDYIFFSENVDSNSIAVYDPATKNSVVINPLLNSGRFAVDGNTACFYSVSGSLYCHEFNPQNDYSFTLPDYNNKVVSGYDFISDSESQIDDHGHGTHVAATIAGNGELKGVAPGATIYSYKVLNARGSGSFSGVISAIDQAVEDGMDIISLSLGGTCYGGYSDYCGPNDPPSIAIDNAVNSGVVAIIAAGNSGFGRAGTIGTPGTASKAITVGAVDKNKNLAFFSSLGPVLWNDSKGNSHVLQKPDVVAPGVFICAAKSAFAGPLGGYCTDDTEHISISGTSMATPHVAGLVALMLQANPKLTPEQVKERITGTAEDLDLERNEQGYGFVNAKEALFGDSSTFSYFLSTAETSLDVTVHQQLFDSNGAIVCEESYATTLPSNQKHAFVSEWSSWDECILTVPGTHTFKTTLSKGGWETVDEFQFTVTS